MGKTPRTESDFLSQEELGRRIQSLCEERGVSWRRLAVAIGVDEAAMSRLESGQRRPS